MRIHELDAALKSMLHGEAEQGSELAAATISFAVPDKDWRAQGSGLELNVYLYRALDNRELRSNARRAPFNRDGTTTQELSPARIECSYVISAWNKGADVAGLDREIQEHRLLSQVLYVLWRNPTMPSHILADLAIDLENPPPILAAESEDMAAKPDFWHSLDTPVRPSVTCRITIEMKLDREIVLPLATTIQTTAAPDESIITIGGTVRNASSGDTIAAASISVDGLPVTCVSDPQGRFVIERIAPGTRTLTVRAAGFESGSQQIRVPGPPGSYDVVLTPK
jgi:hypothetical protein